MEPKAGEGEHFLEQKLSTKTLQIMPRSSSTERMTKIAINLANIAARKNQEMAGPIALQFRPGSREAL